MTGKKYDWQVGHTPPPLDEHSAAKHAVFRSYVQRYIEILTSDPRHDGLNLTLVDGFAGGGVYSYRGQTCPGSPLILLDEVASAQALFATTRKKPFAFRPEFIFVEARQQNLEYLRDVIGRSPHAAGIGSHIHLLRERFEAALPDVIRRIQQHGGGHRALFFLDQYGYGDVSLQAIRTILENLKNPEIILTFSVDYIISYLSEKESFLRGVMPAELGIEQIREMLALRDNGGREARWLIQNFLYRHLQERTGAPFYTCFFIKSPASHRSYWLVHISKHPRARDEMAARHWALTNHFIHHGRAGTQMLGYDPGQLVSPDQIPMDFLFDDDASGRSNSALMEELPHRIFDTSRVADGGVTVGELFTEICNSTPATIARVSTALVGLREQKEIQIYTPDGKERPRSMSCDWGDRILPARQRSLFSPFT
ncbi:three-Cys-motif partner protein TcmP [Methylobacterium sp. sgz302541]|uniref:three-Cys-motif partner protein TcmP n=1 Tax=unclassified Methylobacterium TaxID=2615210 RepID=UPI003D35037E